MNRFPLDQLCAELEITDMRAGIRVDGGNTRALWIKAETDTNSHGVHGLKLWDEAGVAVRTPSEFQNQRLRGTFGSSKNK